jgi:hypothetical protein
MTNGPPSRLTIQALQLQAKHSLHATAAQRTRREREFTDDLTKHIRENGSKIQMGGLRQSLNDINTNSLTGVRG